jgi:hypothetical protein
VNDNPVAVDDSATTPEDTAVNTVVSANDTDVDNPNSDLRVKAGSIAGAHGGTAVLQADGRTVRFTPSLNANDGNTPGGFGYTYVASDGAADSASSATVTIHVTAVNDAPVVTSSSASQSVQYSDAIAPVTIAASDVDSPQTALSASTTWKKSTDASFAATQPLGGLTLTATGTTSDNPRTWQLSGRAMVPEGTYIVRVTVSDGSASSYTDVTILVTKEDGTIEYSGDTLKATATTASNSTATVNLAAVVREIADGSLGDKLNTTQVKFTVYKYSDTSMTTPVATCTTGNLSYTGTGVASAGCSVSLTADNYVVKIELVINGYYTAPVEDQAVTVVTPGTGFTTGGGWLTETSLGSRSNFGFTVKYLKNLNIQGNSLYIYRKTVAAGSVANPAGGFLPAGQYNWIIKSNAMGTLTQTCTPTTPKVCNASFEGKNNITAVNRATGVAYSPGGNYTFHVDVTDNSEPGSSPGAGPDTYTIRVWDSTTGDYYKLPGFPTQTKIEGGNIQVKP